MAKAMAFGQKVKNAAGAFLEKSKAAGSKVAKIWVSRGADGKLKPHVRNIAITAGLLAAAAGGAYMLMKHKKHGHVLVRKKKSRR